MREKSEGTEKKSHGSFRSTFMHSDSSDGLLMAIGLLGALGDGFSVLLAILVLSKLMNRNSIGGHFHFCHLITLLITSTRSPGFYRF